MNKEEERPRVDNIDDCSSIASVAEYLEDNPFGDMRVEDIQKINPHKTAYTVDAILKHACYKVYNHNFTQDQLKLQEIGAPPRAYSVLLRIMEIKLGLVSIE